MSKNSLILFVSTISLLLLLGLISVVEKRTDTKFLEKSLDNLFPSEIPDNPIK